MEKKVRVGLVVALVVSGCALAFVLRTSRQSSPPEAARPARAPASAGASTSASASTNLAWPEACRSAKSPAPHEGSNSAIATSQPEATKAASEVLRDGGNAVDAALAAALVLGVVEPANSGLGGGGFSLVLEPNAKRPIAYDFRERAPLALEPKALERAVREKPNTLRDSALAVAVPSAWQGLTELHRRHGKLPLERLARSAIELAETGSFVNPEYTARCLVRREALANHPEAAAIFLDDKGACKEPGSRLVQRDLAKTLTRLARGESFLDVVGKPLLSYLRENGSSMSEEDFAKTGLRVRTPLEGNFLGKEVVSMPPPSSGGAIVIALLQSYEKARAEHPNSNRHHLWTQASRNVFFDRARYFGDPDFVDVPVARMVDRRYAADFSRRLRDDEELALPSEVPKAESQHTTHLSVVDRDGMAVAMTLTINVPFGTGMVVPKRGVLLNNQMDDFFVAKGNSFGLVGNANNAPEPGKIPLSSMAPTMVFEDGKLSMVLGSPGGSGIPTAVASVIRNVFEDGMNGEDAVRRGRIHHQWVPNELQIEPYFDANELPTLASQKRSEPKFPIGRVQLLLFDRAGVYGVSDCRDQGNPWNGKL